MVEAPPDLTGPWRIASTGVFDRWLGGLDLERAMQVTAAMRRLQKAGPVLGRPRVDSIQGSRVHNLKELRVLGSVRVLFAFDRHRQAVMLVGGDKHGSWNRWYRQHIPVAERLFEDHQGRNGPGHGGPHRAGAGLQQGRGL